MIQPVVIGPGLVGWQFLQTTYDRQLETFSQSPELSRDIDYFRAEISNVTNAEDLVNDRRLLRVALGAFGLEDDLNNRYFIQKMLDEGTTAEDSLANRFTDTRYREFSEAFGFGPNEIPQTLILGFADGIVDKFLANSFEVATGAQDANMRVALYAQRTLAELVGDDRSTDAKWFSIMGQPPLRTLFETAMNLPSEFGQADIDLQLSVFEERAEREFGSADPSIFTDEEALDDLIRTYLARAQIRDAGFGQSSGAIALALLQS